MKTLRMLLACAACASSAVITTSLNAQPAPQPAAPQPQYDFGDQGSATLTQKAWQALESNNLPAVLAYTGRCFSLYETAAVEQQAGMTEPVPTTNVEAVHAKWALNDVGTSYFILGQALERAGKPVDAIKAYKTLVEKLAFAKCWDTKGWFWSPADAAKGRIKALEFDAAAF